MAINRFTLAREKVASRTAAHISTLGSAIRLSDRQGPQRRSPEYGSENKVCTPHPLGGNDRLANFPSSNDVRDGASERRGTLSLLDDELYSTWTPERRVRHFDGMSQVR
ncbi:hypothetical protein FRB94_013126 [Tulasnella sp. JGI-2019a]|nr:hypothetical protein FRB94_013126 [Tulasnella sp. JGI-2019a]KAG9034829.1 hypothetical protein FRB95_012522 [Tulasnella sp. JGI-2019a]